MNISIKCFQKKNIERENFPLKTIFLQQLPATYPSIYIFFCRPTQSIIERKFASSINFSLFSTSFLSLFLNLCAIFSIPLNASSMEQQRLLEEKNRRRKTLSDTPRFFLHQQGTMTTWRKFVFSIDYPFMQSSSISFAHFHIYNTL